MECPPRSVGLFGRGGTPGRASGGFFTPLFKNGVNKFVIAIPAAVVVIALALFIIIPGMSGNSYQKAEEKFISVVFSGITSGSSIGNKWDFTVEYEPSSQIRREMDLTDMILDGSLAIVDSQAVARIAFSNGGALLTDIICALDEDGLLVAFPGITDYFLRYLINADDSVWDFSKLDNKKLDSTFSDIVKLYFKLENEIAEVEKGVELACGTSSVKCDVYRMEFTEKATAKFLLDAIAEIKKNSNLMEFMSDLIVNTGGRPDDFEKALEEMEDELKTVDTDKRISE